MSNHPEFNLCHWPITDSDSLFRRQVIATWSSGTGGAGIIGALSYASLTMWLSNEDTLLVMLIVPIIQGITFWLVLVHPPQSSIPITKNGIDSQEHIIEIPRKSFKEKINLVPGLMKYMIPLGLVYLFEYFINQGLVMLFCYMSFCRILFTCPFIFPSLALVICIHYISFCLSLRIIYVIRLPSLVASFHLLNIDTITAGRMYRRTI